MNQERIREKLLLTAEQARDILYEDNKDFEIIKDEMYANSRWSINYYLVVQRISDKKFFASSYSRGATEQQDEGPWEYEDEVVFEEVFPVEKVVIEYA